MSNAPQQQQPATNMGQWSSSTGEINLTATQKGSRNIHIANNGWQQETRKVTLSSTQDGRDLYQSVNNARDQDEIQKLKIVKEVIVLRNDMTVEVLESESETQEQTGNANDQPSSNQQVEVAQPITPAKRSGREHK